MSSQTPLLHPALHVSINFVTLSSVQTLFEQTLSVLTFSTSSPLQTRFETEFPQSES